MRLSGPYYPRPPRGNRFARKMIADALRLWRRQAREALREHDRRTIIVLQRRDEQLAERIADDEYFRSGTRYPGQ